jgi:1-phosphofructokinase/tagatose 6-phosphate kinase
MSQTEVIEYGPVVTAPEVTAFFEKIDYLAKGARFVLLVGSLPRKMQEDFYAVVMQRVRRHRCFIVLDSAGEPLRLGMKGRPHLVVPNFREAEDLVGHEFHDDQDVVDATAMLCDMGARNAIIKTPLGCVARFQVGRRQRVFRANIAPLESVVSTVGSGDAFLAGFVAARFEKLELPVCLRQALAAGAANTQRFGAGVLDADVARRLLDTTDVVELDDAGHAVS